MVFRGGRLLEELKLFEELHEPVDAHQRCVAHGVPPEDLLEHIQVLVHL